MLQAFAVEVIACQIRPTQASFRFHFSLAYQSIGVSRHLSCIWLQPFKAVFSSPLHARSNRSPNFNNPLKGQQTFYQALVSALTSTSYGFTASDHTHTNFLMSDFLTYHSARALKHNFTHSPLLTPARPPAC